MLATPMIGAIAVCKVIFRKKRPESGRHNIGTTIEIDLKEL
jgi:hypothetical protein